MWERSFIQAVQDGDINELKFFLSTKLHEEVDYINIISEKLFRRDKYLGKLVWSFLLLLIWFNINMSVMLENLSQVASKNCFSILPKK